ncbi:hypothetical protein BWQ96_08535 [Gracilariopsis chorda]|uniref:Uncharacterized protein n=1 Tax=Gracilariopsis chorda TaxID=448386 RepID=A0A2V3II30_9FLOR|nr:hypothetical protein BWQ96_08535 [Gracilariopsis chorda]|eukprot:PXF41746.1 hypothetical protein BWQ96_08535 [Gracilariopsis chorda]
MRRIGRVPISTVLMLLLILSLLVFAYQLRNSDAIRPASRPVSPPVPPPEERVHRPIFYLKMHKTASTTISRALKLYAGRHGLSISTASGLRYIIEPNPTSNRYDIIALQHMAFNFEILDTFLTERPNLILTSIRHPTDRAVSWFRQQIPKFERISDRDCQKKEKQILDEFDKFVDQGRLQASQFFQMQERTARLALHPRKMNLTQIVDQFHFIFLQERLTDSFECFCKQHGVFLCDANNPVKYENAKKSRGCVQHMLMQHRPNVLTKGYEQDVQVMNWVREQLDQCVKDIPEHCRCMRS